MKNKLSKKQQSNMVYKSPFLRFIVFLFFVFIPFQIFLVYFIQRLSLRLSLSRSMLPPKSSIKQVIPAEMQPAEIKPMDKRPVKKIPVEKKSVIPSRLSNDDLQLISGIGPKTREVLISNGITSFQQLTELTTEQITLMLEQSGIRIKAVQSWIDQAKRMK